MLNPYEAGAVIGKGAVGAGTSYLLGKHMQGKKDPTRLPMAAGGILKLGTALLRLFGVGEEHGAADMLLGTFDAVGQANVDFLGTIHGLRAARKEKGIRAIAVPISADVKALPAGGIYDAELVGDQVATLGALGVAQPGASMSLDKLREFQSYR